MIKTDWQKCDYIGCKLVAFIRLKNPILSFQVNVCPNHYEEIKREANWIIEDINKNV